MSTPPPDHPVPPDTRELPLNMEIARLARQLWEKYGRPQDRDVAIWLEAERQLLGADPKVNQQSGGAVPAAPLGDVLYPTVAPVEKNPLNSPVPPAAQKSIRT